MNWNTRDLVVGCVQHLINIGVSADRVWVLDNGSKDHSVEALRRSWPDVRIVASPKNVGFASGVNRLLGLCGGRWILLLNSDARPEEAAIDLLLRCVADRPGVAAVGPVLIDAHGNRVACHGAFPNAKTYMLELLRLQRAANHSDPADVDWIGGACMLLAREAVEDVGLLSTDYFMYAEELDWCYRARQKGWSIGCVPSARCTHYVGQSGRIARRAQVSSSKIIFEGRNRGRVKALVLGSLMMIYHAAICSALWLLRDDKAGHLQSHRLAIVACVLATIAPHRLQSIRWDAEW